MASPELDKQHVPSCSRSSAPKGQSQKPTTEPDEAPDRKPDEAPDRKSMKPALTTKPEAGSDKSRTKRLRKKQTKPTPTTKPAGVNFASEQDEAHRDGHATKFTPRPSRTKPAQTTTTNPDGVNFDNQRAKPAPTPTGSKPAGHPAGRSELRCNALRRSSGRKIKQKRGQLTSSATRTLYLGSARREGVGSWSWRDKGQRRYQGW